MARAIDKRIMLDLIIEAKKTDPETGPFSEWLAEYLGDHLPTLTPPNEWVGGEDAVPDPGVRVLAANGNFVGEAYMASNGAWMRHDGFPWKADAWIPLPEPPDRRPPEEEA